MFGPPGHAYVYFTYGMHFCVNVVCQPAGIASAVLLRAGRVVAGESLARRRRAARRQAADTLGVITARDLARGPARLCQALAITRAQNGADLCAPASPLRLLPGVDPRAKPVISTGPRVGVTAAAEVAWRFWLTGDPTVSAYRLHKRRAR